MAYDSANINEKSQKFILEVVKFKKPQKINAKNGFNKTNNSTTIKLGNILSKLLLYVICNFVTL